MPGTSSHNDRGYPEYIIQIPHPLNKRGDRLHIPVDDSLHQFVPHHEVGGAGIFIEIKNVLAPTSRPSTTLAACEVLPLASSVSKEAVFLPFGRSLMNMEISVRLMLLPSSARIFKRSIFSNHILPASSRDMRIYACFQSL